jgi:hypothetical protein
MNANTAAAVVTMVAVDLGTEDLLRAFVSENAEMELPGLVLSIRFSPEQLAEGLGLTVSGLEAVVEAMADMEIQSCYPSNAWRLFIHA